MTDDNAPIERQDKRDSLFLSASVRFDGKSATLTRVRNLSTGGMMIETDDELTMGTRVIAEIRGIGEVEGQIAWCSSGRAGVAFDNEVDPRLARAPADNDAPKSTMPDYLRSYAPKRRPGLSVR